MIPINQFIEVIKKHGALGVLTLWLTYTHFEVQDVKERLYNCLDRQTEINRSPIKEKKQEQPATTNEIIGVLETKKRILAKN
jgi:hypothetical protein